MDIVAIDNFFQEKFPEETLTNSLSKYWKDFYRGEAFIAGRFKSKGLKVYTSVWDVKKKAFYCNCSSLKNPCAHGIDLYFRFKHQYSEFKIVIPEDEEFEKLIAKAIPVDKKRSDFYTAADLERQQEHRTKQRVERVKLMKEGCVILENWIEDAFSMGLADLSLKSISFWKEIASTLVNYKLNALSDRMLDFALSDKAENKDWYEDCIHFLSDLYLFANAFSKIDDLPQMQDSLLRGGGLKVMSKDLENVSVEISVATLISVKQWYQNKLYFEKYLWFDHKSCKLFYVQTSTWEGAYDAKKDLPFKQGETVKGEFVRYGYNQRYYLKSGYQKVFDLNSDLKGISTSFEDVFKNYRALLGSQFVLNEYFFVFEYYGIEKKGKQYLLRDSMDLYLEVALNRKDYFKLKYNSNGDTKVVLRMEKNRIELISYFDTLGKARN